MMSLGNVVGLAAVTLSSLSISTCHVRRIVVEKNSVIVNKDQLISYVNILTMLVYLDGINSGNFPN